MNSATLLKIISAQQAAMLALQSQIMHLEEAALIVGDTGLMQRESEEVLLQLKRIRDLLAHPVAHPADGEKLPP